MSEIREEETVEENTVQESAVPSTEWNPEMSSQLMKKAWKKLWIFFFTMTITVLIVILKQGEKLFLFNFSSNNMNNTTTFFAFRFIMMSFLVFTVGYFVFFTMFYFRQKKLSENDSLLEMESFKKKYDLFDLLSVVPTFLSVFALITGFFLSPAVVEGSSMLPAYSNGDAVLIDTFSNQYEVGDVIIVDIETELLIKRLCAVPGDHLIIDSTGVYINHELVESYVPEHLVPGQGLVPYITYNQIIPEGYYFVMGDNRLNSTDGRRFGLVERHQLLGIVILPKK